MKRTSLGFILPVTAVALVGLSACGPAVEEPASATVTTSSSPSDSTAATSTTSSVTVTSSPAPPVTTTTESRVTLPPNPHRPLPPGQHNADLCGRSGRQFTPPTDEWNAYEHLRPVGAVVFYAKELDSRVAIQTVAHDGVPAFPHWTFRGDDGHLVTDIGTDPDADPGGHDLAIHFDAWSQLVATGAPPCDPL